MTATEPKTHFLMARHDDVSRQRHQTHVTVVQQLIRWSEKQDDGPKPNSVPIA
jgi:hypothetical protein